MDTQFFPHFLRKMYGRDIQITNAQAIELGGEFKAYLTEKLKDVPAEKLEEIWDISPMTVLKRDGKMPFTEGYHPGLILHFSNFIAELEHENQKS